MVFFSGNHVTEPLVVCHTTLRNFWTNNKVSICFPFLEIYLIFCETWLYTKLNYRRCHNCKLNKLLIRLDTCKPLPKWEDSLVFIFNLLVYIRWRHFWQYMQRNDTFLLWTNATNWRKWKSLFRSRFVIEYKPVHW